MKDKLWNEVREATGLSDLEITDKVNAAFGTLFACPVPTKVLEQWWEEQG
jgi:hypothetical protein